MSVGDWLGDCARDNDREVDAEPDGVADEDCAVERDVVALALAVTDTDAETDVLAAVEVVEGVGDKDGDMEWEVGTDA